ncbi:MAG: extracellular solute-binding protein [Bifidobacteriaceae bacterium]|jgi:xylobiose transport system substrate-binding protein|nr:extracellular solute-binding protein [Bifidobacteriaceae bacterium]
MTQKKHFYPAALGAIAIALSLVACGDSDEPSGSGTGDAAGANDTVTTVWRIADNTETPVANAVPRFNTSSQFGQIEFQPQVNQGYQDKMRSSLGGSGRPGIYQNWGGGNNRDYVEAGVVVDLAEAFETYPELKSAFMPSVLDVGSWDGKYYGIPLSGTQPVLLFYNKALFADAGLEAPTTFSELQNAVDVFKGKGIIPISLAGTQAWTHQIYWQWLVDRVGGPEVFQRIADGDWSGWSDPAVLKATEMIADLASSGAFGDNYASVNYGAGGSETLLSEGKAAMYLMGSWAYGSIKGSDPDFVANDLGYVNPPAVEGGKGDPRDVAGNPSTFFSVTISADKDTAFAFLNEMYSEDYVKDLIAQGEVPVTMNASDYVDQAEDPAFLKYQLDMVQEAPVFQQSWDTAIGDDKMSPVKTEMQRLILGQISPTEFIEAVLALQP